MRKITFSEATREAMAEEMEKYPEVFVMGEDLARQGGIFGQFKGLPDEFPGRVIDTPISETFIVGGGVGAALGGARPRPLSSAAASARRWAVPVRWLTCTLPTSSASAWMKC